MLIYKYISYVTHGPQNIQIYSNLNWDKDEHSYSLKKYGQVERDLKKRSYINCPEYHYEQFYNRLDGKKILVTNENITLIENLILENKIKSVSFKKNDILNHQCIKNHKDKYFLIKNFIWFERILIIAQQKNRSGFVLTNNPYLYGEVSISRTARYFPSVIIFKPLIIISALMLFFYWKNNFNFFNQLNDNKIIDNSSKKFFYFGLLSCIFLFLHATFLGLDYDSKIFIKIRKLIIILFILFEILAQLFLTINFLRYREQLKSYINLIVLNAKIIFVSIAFLITFISFNILAFGDPSSAFKNILEWNYFAFLLLFYLLSRLIWK